MNEDWRDLPDWEGRYQVSNLGNVRSLRSGRNIRAKPKLLKPSKNIKGYLQISLKDRNKKKSKHTFVHRLVLLTFVGPCPEGFEGSHLDGLPTNNTLSNLRWESGLDNCRRKYLHGTMHQGDCHTNAKLGSDGALRVRELIKRGVPLLRIAKEFSVDHRTIRAVRDGKTWKHCIGSFT